ncbi:unnamed protein product, partial [marine sediment metagenome]
MRPPSEDERHLIQQWIDKAEVDFGTIEVLLGETSRPFPGAIAFHAQQCAEKYLKAFLTRHKVDFPKTHDLKEILKLVAR